MFSIIYMISIGNQSNLFPYSVFLCHNNFRHEFFLYYLHNFNNQLFKLIFILINYTQKHTFYIVFPVFDKEIRNS
jgi:hypothetical protein